MTIADFDHLAESEKKVLLQKCCGSSGWVSKMLRIFPVNDLIDLLESADDAWEECKKNDWINLRKVMIYLIFLCVGFD